MSFVVASSSISLKIPTCTVLDALRLATNGRSSEIDPSVVAQKTRANRLLASDCDFVYGDVSAASVDYHDSSLRCSGGCTLVHACWVFTQN